MKGKKRIRVLRVLAIAGSMSALVVPTAVARPATELPVRAENSQGQQYQLPSGFHTEAQNSQAQQQYQPPAGFHTEAQLSSRPAQQPFHLPSRFKPEVQTPSSPTVASNPGSVIREIRTVTDDGNPTLALVLAAIALAIALCGSAYAWVRLTRIQRDLSSRALVG
ncbi:MAG TPA: hypothetical protein VF066_17780 [Thermoleophilaceae bacterium]